MPTKLSTPVDPPTKVNALVPAAMAVGLLKLKVPEVAPMVEPEARVIVPDHSLVPLILFSTPAELSPTPLSVSASLPTVILFCSCKVAPLVTVVPAAVVPRALL